jgi:hypothetical protein
LRKFKNIAFRAFSVFIANAGLLLVSVLSAVLNTACPQPTTPPVNPPNQPNQPTQPDPNQPTNPTYLTLASKISVKNVDFWLYANYTQSYVSALVYSYFQGPSSAGNSLSLQAEKIKDQCTDSALKAAENHLVVWYRFSENVTRTLNTNADIIEDEIIPYINNNYLSDDKAALLSAFRHGAYLAQRNSSNGNLNNGAPRHDKYTDAQTKFSNYLNASGITVPAGVNPMVYIEDQLVRALPTDKGTLPFNLLQQVKDFDEGRGWADDVRSLGKIPAGNVTNYIPYEYDVASVSPNEQAPSATRLCTVTIPEAGTTLKTREQIAAENGIVV